MKDEYEYVLNMKVVGGDILTVRKDSLNECIAGMVEFKKAHLDTFGEPERTPITHLPEEGLALENCQFPVEHGMKHAKKGSKGMYCVECWKKKKLAEGTWQAKR